MQKKSFVKSFRILKLIQLCLLLGIGLTFFLILCCNTNLAQQIFSNKPLFLLCAFMWILMLFSFFFLLLDFCRLRSFATESHALNQAAYLDNLTGIPNRHSLDSAFQTYTTPESLQKLGCAMLTICNLKAVNSASGHKSGDRIIQDFCTILEEIGDPFGFVGRNGGNEFVVIINDCSHETMERFFAVLYDRISLYNTAHSHAPITLDSAYTLHEETPVETFSQLLTVTYNKLYHTASQQKAEDIHERA